MKQVIVIRRDLKIGKGKMAAHVAHASLAAYRKAQRKDSDLVEEWMAGGEKKIVVYVASESEMLELFEKVKRRAIPCELIRDAGLTQIEPGTITALGIGPWEDRELDELTGHLKLV